MGKTVRLLVGLALCLLGPVSSVLAQGVPPGGSLDQQFQEAEANYKAGRFALASAELEMMLPSAAQRFDVRELLGLAYAAQSQDFKAVEQLTAAAALQPRSAPARSNLGTALLRNGQPLQAEAQFRKALELSPTDFETNRKLAAFYLQSGRVNAAIPFLERARHAEPSSYDNSYDLAMAYMLTGKVELSGPIIQSLITQSNTGELHNLLAQIDERSGQFLEAAKEYEVAAHMDPSEQNLFDWGSELLLHRTYEPAIDIFQKATERYPKSPRLFIGLGMSLYSRGKYDDAVKALVTAADLDPTDARCYIFLSKAYDASPTQAEEVIERFRRYSESQPSNAMAQYYYAMSLWKGRRAEAATLDLKAIEALLQRAITLDDSLAQAHLQLGNLYADQHEWERSVPQYQRALQLDLNLPDAHYRLGQDYVHLGRKDEAQAEFAIYQKQRAEHLAQDDKERAEVRQFVYDAKPTPPAKP